MRRQIRFKTRCVTAQKNEDSFTAAKALSHESRLCIVEVKNVKFALEQKV
jgi:hypothetical protein